VRASSDGRFRLVIVDSSPFTIWTFAPFYLLVIVTVLFLSWLVAVGIAGPLRTLSATVDRFGRGDLTARVEYERNNEIGRLGRSFNEMAVRIHTLLKSERRLLQDISHELRSPLARLSFAAELARTAPDRQSAIDRIQKEVDRLSALVGELIEVTRAEGDPDSRPIHPVPVGDVVREVVDECAVEADARKCQVVLHAGTSRTIKGDRELLRRAFENVVRNAIRFTPAGTSVDVTVEEQATDTIVVIRDHGPGVPSDALPRIFGPFYRVDGSRDAQSGGLGLGLAIAYRAIHLHHGSIAAENDRPGLRVTVTLPHSGAA
jgi:two-component system sensor histidine kinase CpxA